MCNVIDNNLVLVKISVTIRVPDSLLEATSLPS